MLIGCLMEEAGNLLYRLPKGAPVCGSHIKNMQHEEQITPKKLWNYPRDEGRTNDAELSRG